MISDRKDLKWAARRDLTAEQYGSLFQEYRRRGYLLTDMEAYPSGRSVRYAMVWRENFDGRRWASRRDMSDDGYGRRWEEYKQAGYRPIDVETYQVDGQRRWAGIWVENREGLRWLSNRGLTSSAYGKLFRERRQAGYRLIDVEIYTTAEGRRYAGIWVENRDNIRWEQLRGMKRSEYQQAVDQRSARGLRVVDYESYRTSDGQRYAAIWEAKNGRAYKLRTNLSELHYANLIRRSHDQGMRIFDFERYETANGPRYAGAWIENSPRYRFARKADIDDKIDAYSAANNIPGISVAVVQDGEMVYRRGFGHADVERGREAHGGTVYLAASVSKVIGGTLAAKLEDEGRLRDGTRFELDLRRPTRDYLGAVKLGGPNNDVFVHMPASHTHRVQELLSHSGCVPHYPGSRPPTTPGIANNTLLRRPACGDDECHYVSAVMASQLIWNTHPLRFVNMSGGTQTTTPCTVGTSWRYSTPAFTYIAAVLEVATGRPIHQLVDEEIADQYDLGSMRVQWSSPTLPPNYDRAQPYTRRDRTRPATPRNPTGPVQALNPNVLTQYRNSSWKVLGGGIETSAVDLAWFGWKTLDGEIIDATARDARLWMPVTGSSALAWRVAQDADGRRIARHGGSWSGARCHLLVYRDDDLVVAVMTNRGGGRGEHDPSTLAAEIGDLILDN